MPFGVDEAGRGPVFGSMFAACVRVETADHLPDGVADSKRLTPARREELAAELRAHDRIAVGVAEITPARIDAPETDMNGLAVEAHARAIEDAFDETVIGPGESPNGHCDACDTDEARFARRVTDACAIDARIEASHGADDADPLVAAASVIAKVERDAHVAALATAHGEIGSGYPSDPTTREFLETYVADHGELPPFARSSWSTCREALAAATQSALDAFGDG